MLVDFDGVTFLALALVATGVLLIAHRRRRSPRARLLLLRAFSLYLIVVAAYTVFPIPVGGGARVLFDQPSMFLRQINLIPLRVPSLPYLGTRQIVGNILLAVPFGFALPFLWQVGWIKMLLLGAAFGLTIEAVQLAISLALQFPYRTIDINDSLFNALGVVGGYAPFHLFSPLYLRVGGKIGLTRSDLGSYLMQRCAGYDC